METPEYLVDILAKSANRESLFTHTWLVLSRFVERAKLQPALPQQLNSPRLWHRLYWACLLHDFGKVATGFQAMLLADPAERKAWGYRHEVASLAFLGWVLPDGRSDDYRWIVAAVVSHHKDADLINATYKQDGEAIRAVAAQLVDAPLDRMWRWLNDYATRWHADLDLDGLGIEPLPLLPEQQAVALVRAQGVAQIEQALRCYRRFIRAVEGDPDLRQQATAMIALRGSMITADHSASAHTGPPPLLPRQDYLALVQRLGWSEATLHTHQTACATSVGNLILAAPTGSGKTEAALFWTFGTATTHVPRLFYALPYQASMNAMHQRLTRLFPEMVGLQHGRALQALYRVFIEDGDDPRNALIQATQRKSYTELNYYPVRVFSPYQMLKACYKLRGYESILSDYFNATFIFDEIHAYEPKRLALILTLICHLRVHHGARFLIMSATFPDLIKQPLSDALGDFTAVNADAALFTAFQRHRLHLLDGNMLNGPNVARIVDAATAQRSVLVCCNTVARAQSMFKALKDRLDPDATIVLLHGRLNGRDRLTREQQVIDACGLDSAQRQPIVLIATQVVEVSLNLDLDTIFTDIAPLEALIQRFGRVNRARKQRNPEGEPLLAPVYVFREPIPDRTLRPYDRRLLTGTLRLLQEIDGRAIDESAVGTWLNTIYEHYADDYMTTWNSEYQAAAKSFAEGVLASLVAFNADQELEEQFYSAFDSIDVLPEIFEPRFFALMQQGHFIDAAALTVGIRKGQSGMLARAGKLRFGDAKAKDPLERITVVKVPYDDDLGLLLNQSTTEQPL